MEKRGKVTGSTLILRVGIFIGLGMREGTETVERGGYWDRQSHREGGRQRDAKLAGSEPTVAVFWTVPAEPSGPGA